MGSGFHILPDSTRILTFITDRLPDFKNTIINIQSYLKADIPTYTVFAEVPMSQTNLLSIWNKTVKRLRVQEAYAIIGSTANNTVRVRLSYINTEPNGGTNLTLNKRAFDYDNSPNPPDDVVIKTNSTVTPVGNTFFGGTAINLNTSFGQIPIFEPKGNSSAILLRPQSAPGIGQDGLLLWKVAGTNNSGNLLVVLTFTLD